MAAKKRYARTFMVLAALAAFIMALSYFGVHHYSGDPGSEHSASTLSASSPSNFADSAADTSTIKTEERAAKSRDQALDKSKAQNNADSEALKQQQGLEEEESAVGEEEAEDDPDELRIAGAVLDDAGQPVEGASVVAELVVNSQRDEESAPQVSMNRQSETTDRLGTFEFRNLDEGEYDLTASKGEDYFPARMKVRNGMANAELVLQRLLPVRVYGTISDEQGIPLDAVSIRTLGTQESAQSDANGGYEIVTAPMRAGDPPVLKFTREGYQETQRRVKAALDSGRAEVQLDVQMEMDSNRPKVAVAGQVLGPIGEAVVGARIGLRSSRSKRGYSARTDESGEFNFSTVETGEGFRLNILPSEDYEAYQSDVFSLGPQDEFFEIELDAANFASLSGTVTDLYGKPLSGFQLWLSGVGSSAQSRLAVQTDTVGRFRLQQLRAGEVVLETRSRPMLRASNILLESGQHKDVDIPLDWGSEWLLGRVVDAQGNPVSGASIVVIWKEQLHDLVSESRRDVRSDMEGYFAVSNLGAEYYTLTVQAPGYQTFRGNHQLRGGSDELVVQLQ